MNPLRSSRRSEGGFALLAVLVALGVLMALAVPFVFSMDTGATVIENQVDQKRAQLLSRGVRDLLLAQARGIHPAIDPDPLFVSEGELPQGLVVPEAFGALGGPGGQSGALGLRRNLVGGDVEDLQRFIDLHTASPLIYANLLGLVGYVAEAAPVDADEILIRNGRGLPDSGYVFIDRELIAYGRRENNRLMDLQRGLLSYELQLNSGEEHELDRGLAIMDFRCLLAVAGRIYFGNNDRIEADHPRTELRPWSDVAALAALRDFGFGEFSAQQMDVLRRHLVTGGQRESAADWGRSERVFNKLNPGEHRLRVRGATNIGGGSIVRVRSVDGQTSELALVVGANARAARAGAIALPETPWILQLLGGLKNGYGETDVVVEPLLPTPVNINTAAVDTLAALFANVRETRFTSADSPGGGTAWMSPVTEREAADFAATLVGLRTPGSEEDDVVLSELVDDRYGETELGPFEGFEDLARRFFQPRIGEGVVKLERQRLPLLHAAMMTGRLAALENGTMPITFRSAPVVRYRAAASVLHGSKLGARQERRGVAVVMPDATLDRVWATQEQFEEAMRLDQRAPWFLTHPINVGAQFPLAAGSNPSPRTIAHLLPIMAPSLGIGARFPERDGEDAGFRAQPASTPFVFDRNTIGRHFDLWDAQHPDGRDVLNEGPLRITNSGPTGGDGPPPAPDQRGTQPRFPFTAEMGLPSRVALSFWFTPREVGDQIVLDVAADQAERNRITLALRNGFLELEVLDEAGLDPEPDQIARVQTSPERTAGTWRVPVTDLDLQPGVAYHASLGVYGNRPGQLSLFVDGKGLGQSQLITTLTRPIEGYDGRRQGGNWRTDARKYPEIFVENTEGFPERGILRIGLELFEYTSKSASSFSCAYIDSFGGRAARMRLREWRPDIEVDENGRPTRSIEELIGNVNLDVAPEHPSGAAVELYGYSLPLYRNTVALDVGIGSLNGGVGAFSIARLEASNGGQGIIVSGPNGQGSVRLGSGILDRSTDPIELGDPVASSTERYQFGTASERITSGFPSTGGYALLVQRRYSVTFNGGQTETVGGVELIRYASRQGTRLTGIERGVSHPLYPGARNRQFFSGQANKYVVDWSQQIRSADGKLSANQLPQMLPYVVPISLPVTGLTISPQTLERTEWVQLFDPSNPVNTEWVRVDFAQANQILRVHPGAWDRLRFELTRQSRLFVQIVQMGQNISDPGLLAAFSYGQPDQSAGTDYIGYTDQIEVDFPAIWAARRSLGFRGDPFTGTTSHAHSANAIVTPCHRMELDWGNLGALSARAGRNDRVALVGGSQATGDSRPPVEWHTVNWTARRYGVDGRNARQRQRNGNNTPDEFLGAAPFQLVAFQRGVNNLFVAPDNRQYQRDVRLVDRMVKFPSGEMPAAAPDAAVFGGSQFPTPPDFRGIVDEVTAILHSREPVTLDQPMTDTAVDFLARRDVAVRPFGDVRFAGDLTASYPRQGGLVRIGDEILAYRSHAGGRFQVAANGRGLLGTEPRAHAIGERVHLLDHVPCAILAGNVSEGSAQLVVENLNALPRHGGALLVGRTEVLHYAWTDGQRLLEMPEWRDPDAEGNSSGGLFRGRFGTAPAGAAAGEAVIWQPFRYWDRFHERADDPELAHFQLTWQQAPVLFHELSFAEERVDPRVQVRALVRVDGHGSFADDPARTAGLFEFSNHQGDDAEDGGRRHPILMQGSRLEARFQIRYLPGAFDPLLGRANGWKRTPIIRRAWLTYEGEQRILDERVTTR